MRGECNKVCISEVFRGIRLTCSSSFVLLNLEEVFAFKCTILRQVCAVDSIADTIHTEPRSQSVRSQALRNFRVHGAHKVTERLHSVLLSDLKCNARASCHLLRHLWELGQHALIDLKELLGSRPIEVEHLHGTDLEALVQNRVNDLTGETCLDGVRLNHGARAVSEHCTGAALTREPHAHLGGLLLVV